MSSTTLQLRIERVGFLEALEELGYGLAIMVRILHLMCEREMKCVVGAVWASRERAPQVNARFLVLTHHDQQDA
jgi:hypothetical protein